MPSVPTARPFLILASGSPRRRELLAEAGYEFDVIPADPSAETAYRDGEAPRAYVVRMAECKALDVAQHVSAGLVLAADTIAECDGRVLGKPDSRQHAQEMLELLRGTTHQVHTGVCLLRMPEKQMVTCVVTTTLAMDAITDAALDEYLESLAWEGKAGAFGLQDRLGWIRIVEGSATNVVGLPMDELAELISQCSR